VRALKVKEAGRLSRFPTLGVLCFIPLPIGANREVEEGTGADGFGDPGSFSCFRPTESRLGFGELLAPIDFCDTLSYIGRGPDPKCSAYTDTIISELHTLNSMCKSCGNAG